MTMYLYWLRWISVFIEYEIGSVSYKYEIDSFNQRFPHTYISKTFENFDFENYLKN